MSRRLLQATMGVLALVPVVTGILSLLGLADPLYRSAGIPPLAVLDNNIRFFGGLWLGVGIALLWLIPTIEKQSILFRAIWGAIFLGGVGRLLSIALFGSPPIPFFGFTALEILGAPLFVYWQYRVARDA